MRGRYPLAASPQKVEKCSTFVADVRGAYDFFLASQSRTGSRHVAKHGK